MNSTSLVEQIKWTIQSAGIPILGIVMAIAVFNMMRSPGKVTLTEEENFEVKESSLWLIIASFGVIAGAIFVWLGSGNPTAGSIATAYVMAAICFVATAVTLHIYFRHKLVVKDETFTIYPIKGKSQTHSLKVIGKMEAVQGTRCEELKFYNRNGIKLFEVQGYMVNAQYLKKYMRRHYVRVVKIDNEKNTK